MRAREKKIWCFETKNFPFFTQAILTPAVLSHRRFCRGPELGVHYSSRDLDQCHQVLKDWGVNDEEENDQRKKNGRFLRVTFGPTWRLFWFPSCFTQVLIRLLSGFIPFFARLFLIGIFSGKLYLSSNKVIIF